VLLTGYLHQHYTESLAEFGDPLLLPRSGGWLLRRHIEGSLSDAMGTYPLFSCSNWNELQRDFQNLDGAIVSVVAVVDPFGDFNETLLRDCFPDAAAPFKSHFFTDLTTPYDRAISDHHARNAEIGLSNVTVECCTNPAGHLDEWVRLYDVLIQRHQISGIRAFSRNSFLKQLQTPGMVCFRALHDGQTVGMILWYVQNTVAYYHLGAYTDKGYDLRASFALFRTALDHFAQSGLHFASLGAGAGLVGDADDGLTRFKSGWCGSTRPSFLCGRIFNRSEYDRLTSERSVSQTSYFPAYRKGEFS
jgi:Acetyltransferase (GNAT) domain